MLDREPHILELLLAGGSGSEFGGVGSCLGRFLLGCHCLDLLSEFFDSQLCYILSLYDFRSDFFRSG